MSAFDSVLGWYLNPETSGVAKFNQQLAQRCGVPVRHVLDRSAALSLHPLISIKLSDCTGDDATKLYDLACTRLKHKGGAILFHELPPPDLEMLSQCLADSVDRVFGASREVAEAVNGTAVWCPSLLSKHNDQPLKLPTLDYDLRLVMFGMVGKVQIEPYQRLKAALDRLGLHRYGLWCSTAHHESTTHDPQALRGMHALQDLFGEHLQCVGTLSDAALAGVLQQADGCAAFFPKGARENNTSVHAAMSLGCPVITNLDRYSPFSHLREVYDVDHFAGFHQVSHVKEWAHRWASAHSWDALLVKLTETRAACVN